MPRRFGCPLPRFPDAWIDLPDLWLGQHAQRRDDAVEQAQEKGFGTTLLNFAVAIALLDDWNLPGLGGNPEKWDFTQLDLGLINWVINTTIGDFNKCFEVPKVSSGQ